MALGVSDVAALRANLSAAGYTWLALYNPDQEQTTTGEPIAEKSRGKVPMAAKWQQGGPQPLDARALNTGILATGLQAIDIDIDDPELARTIRDLAAARWGEAPLRSRGSGPRCLMLCRAPPGMQPAKRSVSGPLGKVEVLGRGQQFHSHGIHYTGAPLEWLPEPPEHVPVDQLPIAKYEDVAEFLREVAPLLGTAPETTQPHHKLNGHHAPSRHGLTADIFTLARAIDAIQNGGAADWEGWNRRGMMLWAATGGNEAGRALWHEWSKRHPSYDEAATDERWDHYATSPPTGIGAGSIFHEARQQQEEPPPAAEADYGIEPTPQSDTTGQPDISTGTDVPPLPVTYFSDIRAVHDAKDFVQGTLTERAGSVVYGESNAGKTFWATDLALHVAYALTWNGRRVEQGAVVYCVLEGSMGFHNRVAAWRAAHCDVADIPFVAIECGINLLNPDADTPRLIETIKVVAQRLGIPVKLIVVDTLSRALAGGNENSPEDMGALVVNMDRIRAETGAHVMFIHHSGKDAAKGARGHSLLRAAIDTEIEVVAEEGTARKTAAVVKQRELKKGDVFEFTLTTVEIGFNRHGEAVTTCLVQPTGNQHAAPAARKQGGSAGRALEVLTDLIAATGQIGFAGTPANTPSVPEAWWRERFYEAAMAGAEEDTKRKAFRRTADALVQKHIVGMGNRRVWLVRKQPDVPQEDPRTPE